MLHYYTVKGEVVEYEDLKKMLRLLFSAYRLDKAAVERAVDIAVTLDGSQLTKHLSFVMAGVKLVDIGCKSPHTGIYEMMPCEDADGNTFYMPQTRRNCFPVKICMGKESNQMYQDEFGAAFYLFNEASVQ